MTKPKITESDLCRAAERAGTSTAEIETFLAVETRGNGFDSQGRPVILFERHWFHKLTRGKYSKEHPDISNPRPGGYGKSSEQYARFSKAFRLDPEAAMKSASWGRGQVMGFNHKICGYPTVGQFVDAIKESEGKQLDAAIEFIIFNGLDDELRRHDWRGFARGYNGPAYEKNDYHNKLRSAYAKFSKRKINCSKVSGAPATDEPGEAPIPAEVPHGTDLRSGPPIETPPERTQAPVAEQPPDTTTVTQYIPKITEAKNWLLTLTGGGILSTGWAALNGLPPWALFVLGILTAVLIGGLVWLFVTYYRQVFTLVRHVAEINANPHTNTVQLVSAKDVPPKGEYLDVTGKRL